VTVRPGAGTGGSTRVTFTWPDGAIRNTWLQVTVLADAATRRLTPDVSYFGNLVGETGDRAVVTGRDVLAVRADLLSRSVPVTSRSDFDRDGRVTALDVVAARNNLRRALPAPVLPAAPAAAPPLATPRASGLLKEE
jgi:hypothetical protein